MRLQQPATGYPVPKPVPTSNHYTELVISSSASILVLKSDRTQRGALQTIDRSYVDRDVVGLLIDQSAEHTAKHTVRFIGRYSEDRNTEKTQRHKVKQSYTQRLATANRFRVSIRGRPRKIFLRSSLITMQNLVVVSDTVRAHVSGPINLGGAGPRSFGMGCG